MPIGSIPAYWAERKPDETALSDDRTTLTWAELDSRTNRLARDLERRGVGEGSFVMIALPNSTAVHETAFAAWKLGATPLPISWRMPAAERDALVALVDPAVIVGPDEVPGFPTLPIGHEPDPALPDGPLPERVPPRWKALASGGTTGRPKIIVSRDPGEFDPGEPIVEMAPDGRHLVQGPLYHNGPFLFSSLAMVLGNPVTVLPRFDAETVLATIARERITYTTMVPTMMQRIWKLPDEVKARYDLSSLRTVLHTASACPPWLKRAWIEWVGGDVVCEIFGGTEGNGACWISGTEWLEHPGSVGRAMEGFQVKILGPDRRELPPGEVGDVYMLPENGPGSTYECIGGTPQYDADGWEWIGDMGHLDAEGYLFLADRRTDMIISGGANVYPAEVEAAIDGFPGVRSNAVIGLPDEDLGQRVHAVVDAPGGLDEAALLQYLATHLTRYKIPRSVELVDAPVRNDAGKVRRGALRAERITSAALEGSS
ncbi:MAG: AMP-binding protein [Pseudonocardia sp.]|nr:AMP-binding protein [Pseudonocardia sp.]